MIVHYYTGDRYAIHALTVNGDLNLAQRELMRLLRNTPGHLYYIGLASKPQVRSRQHELFRVLTAAEARRQGASAPLRDNIWSDMYVLLETKGMHEARNAESILIKAAGAVALKDLHEFNRNRGRGGRPASGVCYLYVLRSRG